MPSSRPGTFELIVLELARALEPVTERLEHHASPMPFLAEVEEYFDGDISIQPFDRANINPNSYDYRFGDSIIRIDSDAQGELTSSSSR